MNPPPNSKFEISRFLFSLSLIRYGKREIRGRKREKTDTSPSCSSEKKFFLLVPIFIKKVLPPPFLMGRGPWRVAEKRRKRTFKVPWTKFHKFLLHIRNICQNMLVSRFFFSYTFSHKKMGESLFWNRPYLCLRRRGREERKFIEIFPAKWNWQGKSHLPTKKKPNRSVSISGPRTERKKMEADHL